VTSSATTPDPIPYRRPRLRAAWDRTLWALRPIGRLLAWIGRIFASYFTNLKPTVWVAFWPMLLFVAVVYTRCPTTNYIFDEQEALLANPYVNQIGFAYEDAIYRDFWGLPANASIGSYRPVPNYLWRGMVEVGERGQTWLDESGPPWLLSFIERAHDPEPVPKLTEVARRSWFQHLYNLFFHALCGASFTALAYRLSRSNFVGWVTGATFVSAAILTEAVSGVVGIADVLGGLGAIWALLALSMRAHAMPFAVFLAVLLGLFSKESAIVCVPLVPVAAVLFAPLLHPERPARFVRGVLSLVGALAAFVVYTELRKRWFPSPLPGEVSEPLAPGFDLGKQAARDFLLWFHQAPLPKDPLNNPLVDAPIDLRVAGALRVYARGLWQVVFPWTLSGDYSFPQEPIPDSAWFPESVIGWLLFAGPPGAALGLWIVWLRRERKKPDETPEPLDVPAVGWLWRWLARRTKKPIYLDIGRAIFEVCLILFAVLLTNRILGIGPSDLNKDIADTNPENYIYVSLEWLKDALVYAALGCLAFGAITEAMWERRERGYNDPLLPMIAVGMVWLVISYFPHSNMYVLLPTVRAERLWYFPVIGTTLIIGPVLVALYRRARRAELPHVARFAWAIPAAFLAFQTARAYGHAMDYRDDLVFWESTKDAVPNSAKAHLNYSVMAGARQMWEVRLGESHLARKLAPEWAMAHIYTGDTLCRMGRPDEAWEHYARGFDLGPNDKSLISLALQCLWDTGKLKEHEPELRELEKKHEKSWLAWLVYDTLLNGDKNRGVSKEYRPRSYNEAAKDEEKTTETEEVVETVESANDLATESAAGSADDQPQAKDPEPGGSKQ
jgi:protein O-mannosyl-transferase